PPYTNHQMQPVLSDTFLQHLCAVFLSIIDKPMHLNSHLRQIHILSLVSPSLFKRLPVYALMSSPYCCRCCLYLFFKIDSLPSIAGCQMPCTGLLDKASTISADMTARPIKSIT